MLHSLLPLHFSCSLGKPIVTTALCTSSLSDHVATTYGVVQDSILNIFNISRHRGPRTRCYARCARRLCPICCKELLKYLDQNSIVTLEELNDQIETFPYVPLDARNKPTQIPGTTFSSSDHTLKQKGTMSFAFNLLSTLDTDSMHTYNYLL